MHCCAERRMVLYSNNRPEEIPPALFIDSHCGVKCLSMEEKSGIIESTT